MIIKTITFTGYSNYILVSDNISFCKYIFLQNKSGSFLRLKLTNLESAAYYTVRTNTTWETFPNIYPGSTNIYMSGPLGTSLSIELYY